MKKMLAAIVIAIVGVALPACAQGWGGWFGGSKSSDTLQSVALRGATISNAIVTIGASRTTTNTYSGYKCVLAKRIEQEGTTANATQGSVSLGSVTVASGNYSTALGIENTASGSSGAIAIGAYTIASGNGGAMSAGTYSEASNNFSFAWCGIEGLPRYGSHGTGTFNINPIGGLAGLYVGETPMSTLIGSGVTTNHTIAVGDVLSITNGRIYSITHP